MTKTQRIIANLTEDEKAALRGALSNRQGEVVPGTTIVRSRLSLAGLIGPGNGLTQAGTIVRESLMNAMIEELF